MIGHFFRSLHIAAILARYRLDELLLALPPLRFARAIRLVPWGRRRIREQPRGVRFRLALQELGPIYVKFGQILSTRRDLLPEDIAEELAGLQDAVEPFPGRQARAIVERELGAAVEVNYDAFDEVPLASASIAQVHSARLKSGEDVVVKVVRPGIKTRIRRDISLLKTLAGIAQRYHPDGHRIRPTEIVSEFERVIYDELDMQREAANASMLRRNFEHSRDLYIPRVYWSLTHNRVMTMERVDGIPVKDIPELKRLGVDLEKLARRGIRVFYSQVFRDNLFHADMHPGNIRVDASDPDEPSFIALDFGIVASLTPRNLYYIGENFMAIFNQEYRRVAELHVEAGWVPADTRIDELEAAVRTVCEPNFSRPLEEVSFAELVIQLFQVAHRFKLTLQPQLIMLQKTLLNIEGIGRMLHPRLNIWEVAKPELEAIFRERYGLERAARTLRRELPGWLAKAPDLPDLIYDYLKRSSRGELTFRVSSQDLAALKDELHHHNRRLPGTILAVGVLVASSILAAYRIGPSIFDIPVIAASGGILGFLMALRAWRM